MIKKFLFFVIVLGLGVAFFQGKVFAQSELTSLEAKIQELMRMVSQLQTQLQQVRASLKTPIFLGPPVREGGKEDSLKEKGKTFDSSATKVPPMGVVVPPSRDNRLCYNFNFNLSLGSRGEAVLALQRILEVEGFNLKEERESGVFGEATASAVSGFQERYRSEILDPLGLKYPTGLVGKSTRAKLNALYGCETISPGVPPKVMPPETGGVTPSQPPLERGMMKKFIGFLKAAEPSIYMWGTHTLSTQEQVICVKAPCLPISVLYRVKAANDNVLEKLKKLENQQVVIKGYLEYIKLEGGFNGLVAYEVEAYEGSSLPTSSIVTVISPNGGETWVKGTTQVINWRDNTPVPSCPSGAECSPPAPKFWDIRLIPEFQPCTGSVCPMYAVMPYVIAKKVEGLSYKWSVGEFINYSGTSIMAPDGPYRIQVCQSETNNCDSSDGYFKITGGTTTANQPPVIHEVSGPTTLSVNQQGTWTVKASDPENGSLRYSVIWGDEATATGMQAAPSSASFQQSATFTHSYSKAGIYNPTFTVTDDKGASVKTSISVSVGETSQPSITVLSPNGGETWKFGEQQVISWKEQNISESTANAVSVYLAFSDGALCYLGSVNPVANSYTFTPQENYLCPNIPRTLVPGQYKVAVYVGEPTSGTFQAKDYSDGLFSIISPTVTFQSSLNSQMANILESAKGLLYQILETLR